MISSRALVGTFGWHLVGRGGGDAVTGDTRTEDLPSGTAGYRRTRVA